LVTNGDFSNGLTGWNGSDMTVSNEQLIKGGVALNYQSGVVENNKTYKVIIDVATLGASLTVYVGGTQIVLSQGVNTLTVPSNNSNSFIGFNNGSGSVINSISAIEINQKNLARIDYLDDAKGALLTEPQSTNLISYSEDFSNSYWDKVGASVTSGFSAPSADSPLGASKLVEDTSTGNHRVEKGFSITNNEAHTFSVIAKAGEKSFIQLRSNQTAGNTYFNLSNGTIGTDSSTSSSIELIGDGWYRCSVSGVSISTANTIFIYLADADNSNSYTGDGTSGVYIFGAQLEQQSFATSYIPTDSSTVTRNQDEVNNGGNVNSFGSEEGVLYVEVATLSDSVNGKYISIGDGSLSNYVYLRITGSLNQIKMGVIKGGSTQASKEFVVSDLTQFNKLAVRYSQDLFKFYVNGALIFTDTNGDIFPVGTLNTLTFNIGNSNNYFFGKTSQVQVFKKALTDAELIKLTTI